MNRRQSSRKRQNDLATKELTHVHESGADSKAENTYEGIYNDVADETVAKSTRLSHPTSQNGATIGNGLGNTDKTDDNLDALYAMPKEEPGKGDDFAGMYAVPDKKKGQKKEEDDFAALYAQPDKSGKAKIENLDDLYAQPDKNRKSAIDIPMVNLEDMYAMPDKTRKGSEETRNGPEGQGENEGLYSSVQDGSEGLYAMSSSEIPIVNRGEEDGTVMVENELYKL